MPTLKSLCTHLGWPRCRRTREFVARVKALEERSGPGPAGAQSGYRLAIAWDAESASAGVGLGGKHLWVYGAVTSAGMRSRKCYLAPKRRYEGRVQVGFLYHLVFLPEHVQAGDRVFVDDVEMGALQYSYAPGSEWQLPDDLVEQCRVELPSDSPWVLALARRLGKPID